MMQHRGFNSQDTNGFMPLFLLDILLMNIHRS